MPTNLTGTTVIYLQTFQGPPGSPGDAGVSTEQVQDIVANLLRGTDGHITVTYVDSANTLTVDFDDPLDLRDLGNVYVEDFRTFGDVQFDNGATFGQELKMNAGQHIQFATVTGSRIGATSLDMFAFWGGNPRTKPTGWTTAPTGTLTRTTFDTESVTLVELARRVAALITDIRSTNLIGV